MFKGIVFTWILLALFMCCCNAQEVDRPIPEDTKIQTTESGLVYSVLVEGKDGPRPTVTDKVAIHYTGWLEDGTVFDSTNKEGEPVEFRVCQVFPGWTEGFQLMTLGSKYKFTIPARLAFGERGMPPTIPGNATVIFVVELIRIDKGPPLPLFHQADPEKQTSMDSGLIYEVITPAEGKNPVADDIVQVKYAFWNDQGKLVDCSEMQDRDLRYTVGQSRLPFLNDGIQMVQVGARLRFDVPAELGFGEAGAGALVPPNARTIWELELIEILKPLPVPEFSRSPDEKLKTTESGLQYEILKEGTGKSPVAGQVVTVHYAGWLEDGTCFDNTFERVEPATFQLGRLIPGWNEGIPLMKEGAVYKFTIPSELAYGSMGSPPVIPKDALLVFHIELIKVEEQE